MNHIDEYMLDLFVLKPDLLTAGVRAEIEGHLHTCNGCSAIVKSLKEFYVEFATWNQDVSLQAEDIMHCLYPQASVIRLTPYKPRSMAAVEASGYKTVIAAATSSRGAGLNTVATLSSPDQRIIARIRRTPESKLIRVYVHSAEPILFSKCSVLVPGVETEYALDEKGRTEFELPDDKIPHEWNELLVKIGE